MNLIQLWRELDTITSGLRTDSTGSTNASTTASPNGVSGLIHLAMHILSIVPNSAATERIFSQFGVIHTKLRNRLDPEKVRKQALVKSDTIAQHGSLRQRKRKFFADSDDESESNHSPSDQLTSGPLDNSSSEYLSDQHSHEFLPVVRDLLEDVESADPDVRHHPDSDNSSALLLKNLFHYPSAHNGPGTINQLIGFLGRCEQSFRIEVEFHDQIAGTLTQRSDSE